MDGEVRKVPGNFPESSAWRAIRPRSPRSLGCQLVEQRTRFAQVRERAVSVERGADRRQLSGGFSGVAALEACHRETLCSTELERFRSLAPGCFDRPLEALLGLAHQRRARRRVRTAAASRCRRRLGKQQFTLEAPELSLPGAVEGACCDLQTFLDRRQRRVASGSRADRRRRGRSAHTSRRSVLRSPANASRAATSSAIPDSTSPRCTSAQPCSAPAMALQKRQLMLGREGENRPRTVARSFRRPG